MKVNGLPAEDAAQKHDAYEAMRDVVSAELAHLPEMQWAVQQFAEDEWAGVEALVVAIARHYLRVRDANSFKTRTERGRFECAVEALAPSLYPVIRQAAYSRLFEDGDTPDHRAFAEWVAALTTAPVVGDAMVERALSAPFDNFSVSSFVPIKSPTNIRRWMRAALTAALAPEQGNNDG